MPLLDIALLALATWRISSLLANEEGPGGMLERLRLAVGVRYDEASERVAGNVLASEMMCQWCNSIWVGAAWTVFYVLAPVWAVRCALPFALSTGTILIMTSKGLQVFLRHLREGH